MVDYGFWLSGFKRQAKRPEPVPMSFTWKQTALYVGCVVTVSESQGWWLRRGTWGQPSSDKRTLNTYWNIYVFWRGRGHEKPRNQSVSPRAAQTQVALLEIKILYWHQHWKNQIQHLRHLLILKLDWGKILFSCLFFSNFLTAVLFFSIPTGLKHLKVSA